MFGPVLLICLVIFFDQGIMDDEVRHVVAYINESVVLHPNANASWKLSRIVWSVYENVTLLASVQGKIQTVYPQPLFLGRLKLNDITGDLTITNVLSRDALKYRVVVQNDLMQTMTSYIQLSVQEKLVKPRIELRHRFQDMNYCIIMLSCSSKNSNVSLILQPEPGFNESTFIDPRGNSELRLWTSFIFKRTVTFTCSAATGRQSDSSNLSVNCTASEAKKEICPQIRSNKKLIGGCIGALFGCIITCIVALSYHAYKDTKKEGN